MEFTMIYCYRANPDGTFDEEGDLFARLILGGYHNEETLVEGGHMDEIFEEFPEIAVAGQNVVFEVFILSFPNESEEADEEALLERLKTSLNDLIDSGEVEVIEDFDFSATVS